LALIQNVEYVKQFSAALATLLQIFRQPCFGCVVLKYFLRVKQLTAEAEQPKAHYEI
jgi:hypothetical protein